MMKKRFFTLRLLRNIFAIYCVIAIAAFTYRAAIFIWEITVVQGVVVEGSYRGIEIGWGRKQLANYINDGEVRLKPDVYWFDRVGNGCRFVDVTGTCKGPEYADKWVLEYPAANREYVFVTFEEDRVVRIAFDRDWWPVL
jgi:hypothetical protein